jgi:hypothetical protein
MVCVYLCICICIYMLSDGSVPRTPFGKSLIFNVMSQDLPDNEEDHVQNFKLVLMLMLPMD